MHGMYRIIEQLLDEALEERRRQREYYGRIEDPQADLEQEVKLLYARGKLDTETYRQLLEMAKNGQLDRENLGSFQESTHRQVDQRNPRDPGTQARVRSPEIVRKLNQLYSHRSRLVAAQIETERALKTLAQDVVRLQEQAAKAGNMAQQILPDESQARQHLEVKQDALYRAETLQERMVALRQNLSRIEKLRLELATREAELRALESGEQLSNLEADIREQLLDDGPS